MPKFIIINNVKELEGHTPGVSRVNILGQGDEELYDRKGIFMGFDSFDHPSYIVVKRGQDYLNRFVKQGFLGRFLLEDFKEHL
ncbi:hypothetical protein GOV13_01710 [Candidatus Pacearchaeota archaeon]|nr:hypothetical protein [Candidatus Pacearchaeota archaeon]